MVVSTEGERLVQGLHCDIGMEILAKSFCDITPLEATHHLSHTYLFVGMFCIVAFLVLRRKAGERTHFCKCLQCVRWCTYVLSVRCHIFPTTLCTEHYHG